MKRPTLAGPTCEPTGGPGLFSTESPKTPKRTIAHISDGSESQEQSPSKRRLKSDAKDLSAFERRIQYLAWTLNPPNHPNHQQGIPKNAKCCAASFLTQNQTFPINGREQPTILIAGNKNAAFLERRFNLLHTVTTKLKSLLDKDKVLQSTLLNCILKSIRNPHLFLTHPRLVQKLDTETYQYLEELLSGIQTDKDNGYLVLLDLIATLCNFNHNDPDNETDQKIESFRTAFFDNAVHLIPNKHNFYRNTLGEPIDSQGVNLRKDMHCELIIASFILEGYKTNPIHQPIFIGTSFPPCRDCDEELQSNPAFKTYGYNNVSYPGGRTGLLECHYTIDVEEELRPGRASDLSRVAIMLCQAESPKDGDPDPDPDPDCSQPAASNFY
jgi:hypothetical protein